MGEDNPVHEVLLCCVERRVPVSRPTWFGPRAERSALSHRGCSRPGPSFPLGYLSGGRRRHRAVLSTPKLKTGEKNRGRVWGRAGCEGDAPRTGGWAIGGAKSRYPISGEIPPRFWFDTPPPTPPGFYYVRQSRGASHVAFPRVCGKWGANHLAFGRSEAFMIPATERRAARRAMSGDGAPSVTSRDMEAELDGGVCMCC